MKELLRIMQKEIGSVAKTVARKLSAHNWSRLMVKPIPGRVFPVIIYHFVSKYIPKTPSAVVGHKAVVCLVAHTVIQASRSQA